MSLFYNFVIFYFQIKLSEQIEDNKYTMENFAELAHKKQERELLSQQSSLHTEHTINLTKTTLSSNEIESHYEKENSDDRSKKYDKATMPLFTTFQDITRWNKIKVESKEIKKEEC